ncbi:MAG: hypothetical protein DWQ34_14250 [Planctomycetota bacterium]|nr:MAG: hypothetical protein DWQ34_14250 [Planctomycetota bacterium]REK22848.1 MAG: hypothetical protein DWQ41_18820 [Planctomycetota bacterium]REK34012.1 MAG: hypothetical protein DWQ45_14075 [Planctomycetota bacterium]
MQRIAFFEDSCASQLSPIALLRPVFELLCGHFTNRERLIRSLQVPQWGALVRPHLAATYAAGHPEARVNDETWLRGGPTVLVNGRWIPGPGALHEISENEAGVVDGTPVYLTLDPDEVPLLDLSQPDDALMRIAGTRKMVEAGGTLINYPWDLVEHNPRQLTIDFWLRTEPGAPQPPIDSVAIQGRPENVFVDPTAEIDPYVVIDARPGPVWIGPGARVLPFTRIEGPAYIGRESQIFRAHVRAGTSIGPVCRVGGEIEESILHGYVNKYHDGFLGHAYVCPWVNLGALTTNSDLKNDYSPVRVPLSGTPVDTGSTKVGCFIGDHTKTALCSLFNTGSSIGVMCMVLPGGELLPKHVPSFSRIWHGSLEESPDALETGLHSARIAMSRRDCKLTPADEQLLRHVYGATREERETALDRAHARSIAQQPAFR